ncbi:MAG: alpha/beta hydrolase [Roseobacter sp.]|jgi:esterase/lipase superfamily enzyme|nr:alpha/beta hydrolase [Roseobacter sp.]
MRRRERLSDYEVRPRINQRTPTTKKKKKALVLNSLRVATTAILGLLAACGPSVYDEIELMPAPTIYAETDVTPFANVTRETVSERAKLFFVTDRMQADAGDPQAHYNNERGHMLRAGTTRVKIDPPIPTWDEVSRITLARERERTYKLQLSEVNEIGVLPFSLSRYFENAPTQQEMDAAGLSFAAQIDAQLARSKNKDIFIYTHGYNVDFDYSTLVSKELQHFLGYQGAFISYNWTATPSRLAYFRDHESVLSTRRNLRALIEYLSENTRAQRVHLIGYSAGTRLAFEAAYQLALQSDGKTRLGHLILIGSDLDTSFVLQSLEDGLLDAVEDVTFYQSQTDSALAISKFVFGRQRIGQTSEPGALPPGLESGLASLDALHVIDVTDAEAADSGNGHWYFQSSPWASSDLFISLLTDKSPPERGLVRAPDGVVWRFPSNYPDVLRTLE